MGRIDCADTVNTGNIENNNADKLNIAEIFFMFLDWGNRTRYTLTVDAIVSLKESSLT